MITLESINSLTASDRTAIKAAYLEAVIVGGLGSGWALTLVADRRSLSATMTAQTTTSTTAAASIESAAAAPAFTSLVQTELATAGYESTVAPTNIVTQSTAREGAGSGGGEGSLILVIIGVAAFTVLSVAGLALYVWHQKNTQQFVFGKPAEDTNCSYKENPIHDTTITVGIEGMPTVPTVPTVQMGTFHKRAVPLPDDNLISDLFQRYDLDHSGTINAYEELLQLSTNLLVKSHVLLSVCGASMCMCTSKLTIDDYSQQRLKRS